MAWSGLLGHPSHSSWTLRWAQIPSSCGWVLWPCSAEVLRCRKARGPKAQLPSLLKSLPRTSADAQILRFNQCFQKGSIFICNVSTSQNVFMYLSQVKHYIPTYALGKHRAVW